MKILINWIVGIVAVVATVFLANDALRLPLTWEPQWKIVLFVPLLALVNTFVRPLVKLLSMPINCLTFGIFNLVISALMFWLAGYLTGATMTFWSALFGTISVSVISTVLSHIVNKAMNGKDDEYDR
jgi:putative membrane protein